MTVTAPFNNLRSEGQDSSNYCRFSLPSMLIAKTIEIRKSSSADSRGNVLALWLVHFDPLCFPWSVLA